MQIKVKNLTHIFDIKTPTEFLAIEGVNATFKQGEFVTIIGETGSGKTTFIEHLNALLRPTKGEVIINKQIVLPGRKKIKKINELRKRVGIVFQFAEYQLFEDTIEKDIIFGPINMGISKEKAKALAKKYIKLVGMKESFLQRSPFALSGGQKRRIALAGILAMEPDVLILDEPTAGLDPDGAIQMYKIFKRLNKEGKTIIIVTHNLDHVLAHSDRTLIFHKTKLVMDDSSIETMYRKDMLLQFDLEPPKIANFVWELEAKGLKIGKVRTIKELVKKIKE